MKYHEAYTGTKSEFSDFIKKALPDLFAGRLQVEGQTVRLPSDVNFDYKVKYDEDEQGGSVSIKVAWDNDTEEVETED